jgi:hypothetical protein
MPDAKPTYHTGAIVGSAIVIIILILGILYFWGAQLEKNDMQADDSSSMSADANTVSDSDQVADIEADVNAADLGQFDAQIDADMANIETQL